MPNDAYTHVLAKPGGFDSQVRTHGLVCSCCSVPALLRTGHPMPNDAYTHVLAKLGGLIARFVLTVLYAHVVFPASFRTGHPTPNDPYTHVLA